MIPRLLLWLLLATSLAALAGCLDTLAQAMIAPESLAVQGVSNSVEAATGTGASEVSGALGSTAKQLDDIIAAQSRCGEPA